MVSRRITSVGIMCAISPMSGLFHRELLSQEFYCEYFSEL